MNHDGLFRYAYFNSASPAYLSGINAVYNYAKRRNKKVTRAQVKEWLERQNTYTLHKAVKRRMPRGRFLSSGIDSDWQADLCDMKSVKQFNKIGKVEIQYLLTVIDVLSKFAWVQPLPDKTATATAEAFEKILKRSQRKPWRLFTDKGKEFLGRPFKAMLDEHDIKHLQARNDEVKAGIVERYNRTLKTRLWKYFTQRQTKRYLPVLQRIVKALNNSYHRSIKTTPASVTLKNENQVWETLYGDSKPKRPVQFRFRLGARVRITRYKHVFEKGFTHNFSNEIYTVVQQIPRQPPVYALRADDGEAIDGLFYEHEMVPFEGRVPRVYKRKRQN